MAIEDTYSSLMSDRRKVRKKAERNALITDVGTTAAKLYADNLKSHALDFFKRSEVTNQRVNYKANKELFDNKIKKAYEEGSTAMGGLGSYLVTGVGSDLARKRIHANIDEKGVMNPDDLGSAVTSYSEEMVYGKKAEDGTVSEENRKAGMLYRLEEAYKAGKNLGSMDAYDDYVDRRADLPETVGAGLMNRFVRGKDRAEIEKDALDRVVNQNKFAKDSEAFSALAKSFDAGISIKDSEKLAQQVEKYTKGIAMKPDEVKGESELITAERYANGKTFKWTYLLQSYVNSRTGAIRKEKVANTADKFSERIFNNQYTPVTLSREVKLINPTTLVAYTTTRDVIYNLAGEEIAGVTKVVSVEPSEKTLAAITNDTKFDATLIASAGDAVDDILFKFDASGELRDAFNPFMERLKGEDDAQAAAKREGFNYKVARVTGALEQQYGMPKLLARRVAAMMSLDDVKYNKEADDIAKSYAGNNLIESKEINGLRVLEALNYLDTNDNGLDYEMNGAEKAALLNKLVTSDNLSAFAGKGTSTAGSIFDNTSRDYYLNKMPKASGEVINKETGESKPVVANLYDNTTAYDGITIGELIRLRTLNPDQFKDGVITDVAAAKGKLEKNDTTFLQGVGKFLKGSASSVSEGYGDYQKFAADTDLTLNALRGNIIDSVKQSVTAASKDQVDSATLNYKAKQSLSDEIGKLRAYTQSGEGSKDFPNLRGMTQTSSLLNNPAYGRELSEEEFNEIMNKPGRSKEEKDRLMAMAKSEISSDGQ